MMHSISWRPPFDFHTLRQFLVRHRPDARIARRDRRLVPDGALPCADIHRVLVCRPNHRLGNMLLLTPLIAELEQLMPGAEVDLLLGGECGAEIFANYPRVRRVHCLTSRIIRHPLRLWRTLRDIRRVRYDLVIDATSHSRSGRIVSVLANARHMIGWDHEQTSSTAGAPLHFAHEAVAALRRATGYDTALAVPPLSIRLSRSEIIDAGRVLHALLPMRESNTAITVGIFANASGAKQHSREWWLQLLDALHALRPQWNLVEILPGFGRSMLGGGFPTFYSSDIRRMAALMSRLDAVISTDSGVMHLASASGTRTFGLFSVTDHRRYGPYGNGSRAFVTRGLTPRELAEAIAEAVGEHAN